MRGSEHLSSTRFAVLCSQHRPPLFRRSYGRHNVGFATTCLLLRLDSLRQKPLAPGALLSMTKTLQAFHYPQSLFVRGQYLHLLPKGYLAVSDLAQSGQAIDVILAITSLERYRRHSTSFCDSSQVDIYLPRQADGRRARLNG